MRPALIQITLTAIAMTALLGSSQAADTGIKEKAKEVGEEVREAAVEVGKTSKEIGKKVAAKAVEAGHATRDGAEHVVQKVRSKTGKPAAAATSSAASTTVP